jgi:lysophospholipid acyltransferase (LPLAT)-like uncharacterized protein
MKFRNNWTVQNKQWDKFQIRLRLGKIDVFTIEIDVSREFYMIAILNFSIKNR